MPPSRTRLGLKVLHTVDDAIVDIVFVHGLSGDRERTWTDSGTNVFWPNDLLPEDIPKSRIFSYGYDADVVHFWAQASQNRISNHAHNLLNAVAQIRDRTETDDRPILYVVHSLGGLVFEDMLLASRNSAEEHLQQVLDCTYGVCFLGTPHCGASLASWASVCGNVINVLKHTNTNVLSLLTPDSEVLARIQQEFHTMLRTRLDQGLTDVKITCFYEELPVIGVGEVVPKHSAILPSYNSIGIHANHMSMTKFSDSEDEGYKAVSSELMRWTRNIRKARLQPPSSQGPRANSPSYHQQSTRNGQHLGNWTEPPQQRLTPAEDPNVTVHSGFNSGFMMNGNNYLGDVRF